jgi:hypothetical protein
MVSKLSCTAEKRIPFRHHGSAPAFGTPEDTNSRWSAWRRNALCFSALLVSVGADFAKIAWYEAMMLVVDRNAQ